MEWIYDSDFVESIIIGILLVLFELLIIQLVERGRRHYHSSQSWDYKVYTKVRSRKVPKRLREKFRKIYALSTSGYYYNPANFENSNDYFCARCFDNDKRVIRVTVNKDDYFSCPLCGNTGIFNSLKKTSLIPDQIQDDYDRQVEEFLHYGQ